MRRLLEVLGLVILFATASIFAPSGDGGLRAANAADAAVAPERVPENSDLVAEYVEYRFLPGVRGFHPFARPAELPDHLTPIGDALQLLADLHRARNHRSVAATISRLLGETRAHVGFAQVRNSGIHFADRRGSGVRDRAARIGVMP